MRNLLRRIRARQGFTLVEVLVVVTIVSILSAVAFTLITTFFSISLRSSEQAIQAGKVETVFGFLGSRLAVAQSGAGDIGFTKNAQGQSVSGGALMPNDLYFNSAKEGTGSSKCYRLHYTPFYENDPNNSSSGKLELAISADASACSELSDLSNTFAQFKPGGGRSGATVYTIADGVVPLMNDSGTREVASTACKEDSSTLYGGRIFAYNPSPGSGPSNFGASTASDGNSVTDILVSVAVCPNYKPEPITQSSPREFSQNFSVGQLCLVNNTGTSQPADNSVGPAQISGFPSDYEEIAANAVGSQVVRNGTSIGWYKLNVPSNFADNLWKLENGFYSLSFSAEFTWETAQQNANESGGVAIVNGTTGNVIAANVAPLVPANANPTKTTYVSVYTGLQLTASSNLEFWVRATETNSSNNTANLFKGATLSGVWQTPPKS